MPPKPDLTTPGELLSQARKGLGRSLPEVEERTKIPLQVLEAIERDEYHKVSGELYVKSFLRAYAADLRLEPEEVLALYGQFSGETAGGSGIPGAEDWAEEVQITRIGLPWPRIILILAMVLISGGVAVIFGLGADEDDAPDLPVAASAEQTHPASEDSAAVPVDAGSSAATDTLAGGGSSEPGARTEIAPEPATQVTSPTVAAPAAVAGREGPIAAPSGTEVKFTNGRQWSLILRIVCNRKQTLGVKRDAEREFRPAQWPAGDAAAEALNAEQIVAGWAYSVQGGMVLYWGAQDHFSLRLADLEDVEVSLNGVVQDISGLRPGQEMLLDEYSARR